MGVRKQDGEDGPVRRVLDPIVHRCHACPIYGADPPGREYPSMAALLQATENTLTGYKTESDESCWSHLEGVGRCQVNKAERYA